MDDYDLLTDDQSKMLRHFQEVTNIQDEQVAVATLASLDWDLQRAIEAQLSNSGSAGSVDVSNATIVIDDDENTETAAATETDENEDQHMNSFSERYLDDDDLVALNDRLNAGSSVGHSGNRSSPHLNGMNDAGSSSTSRSHRVSTTTSSGSGVSSRITRSSRSRASELQQHGVLPEVTSSNSITQHDVDQSDLDSDDEIFHDADLFANVDYDVDAKSSQQDDRVPLVPSEFTSVEEAMHNFVAVFEARYGGNHPPFYSGSLQNAIRDAFDAPGRPVAERRPLAVYLHNDNSLACNIFAKNVLSSDVVSSLLKGQFITWPWDITQNENRLKLFEWMDMLNVRDIRRTVEKLSNERFPLLVVILKEKGIIQPVDVAWGCDGPQQVVEKLMEGLDQYQRIKNADAAEERERIEREEIRKEQAREYERSLAQDRARQEKLEREREEQKAEEERRAKEQELETKRLQELAASLPKEPGSNEVNIATVRVRFPNGDMEIRRFRMSEPLRHITIYVESKGYSLDTHRIWTSDVPKKNVVESFDLNRSLADIKWPVREQITVDEK